ncbi:MAG: hypothetical protein HW390_429 [Candidatus Brocadiaceae bacterium]|nr:hypothetical protein [Candidatus Brocadiaceae bacterium]
MRNYIAGEKDIDNTISKIAEKLREEFRSDKISPFVALINPNTQCFHYYGRTYYKKLLYTSEKKKEMLNDVIKEVYEIVNAENDIIEWYDEKNLVKKVKDYLDKQTKSIDKKEVAIEVFLDLLFKTPISINYGVIGQCYHTGIPRIFYNENQIKYSGAGKYLKIDQILTKSQGTFGEIINKLEKVFWEGHEVTSAIMAPLFLNGQIIGTTFIGDENLKYFTYYDYIRFLKLTAEVSITLIKDAKEYEFLSAVLKDLPNNSFNVAISIFKNLPHIFNITGACLKEKNIYKYLSYNKHDDRLFPEWQENQCNGCNTFEDANKLNKPISFDGICNIHKNNYYLKSKSGLYVKKNNLEFILYFDIDENLLKVHKDSLNLAIDDALELIKINDRNVVVHRAYGHDTTRLFNKIRNNDKFDKKDICKVIEQRNYLMMNLFGEDINVDCEKSIYEKTEILQLWEYFKPKRFSLLTRGTPICAETFKLFSDAEPSITIKPNVIIYKPALNTIILNLIGNTFQHGGKFCVKQVHIDIDKTFTYTQEYKTGARGDGKTLSELPSDLSSYLKGNNVDYKKSNIGFGHYIIQWICNRFKCKLTIELQNGIYYWIITSDKLPFEGKYETPSYKLSYKITLPDEWK